MKPIAGVSLDLDNQWSYMKTHGETGWEAFPSYLDIVVPRVLEFMEERGLKITFFVVGQDAALEKNRKALSMIAEAGHEIGNHSFHHEPWLHLYDDEEVEKEISRAEDAIEEATGVRPIGFRGPGFSVSETVLTVLKRRGYHYDASTFPTYLGPLARAYYFMTTHLSDEEKEKRKTLFGTLREGRRPLKPYLWRLDPGPLVEIPVTTFPVFRTPIHASYLLYLAKFASPVASIYWKSALRACKFTGVQLSLLLHPLDFLGGDDTDALSFFPAMSIPSTVKMKRLSSYLQALCDRFTVLNMREHAERVLQSNPPTVDPVFRQWKTSGKVGRE